jgi:hypothetical protein
MFTYNENRILLVERGRLEFPCDVTANIELYPSAVYGDPVPGVTCALNSQAQLRWNANTGRSEVESHPPLLPPSVSGTVAGMSVTIVGHVMRAAWRCSSRAELTGALGALHFILPLCLGLELADPTIPAVTSGCAGEAAGQLFQPLRGTAEPTTSRESLLLQVLQQAVNAHAMQNQKRD